jgi:autotransporter translocation and assembly factor TamB
LAVLAVIAIAVIETSWTKDRLRAFIVDQANRYLTATLEIGRLGGSLFGGVELGDVVLSRNGERIVEIDEVRVVYSLRELWDGGTTIRRLVVTRPRIVADRGPDGRWNLGGLVRRDEPRSPGPRRRIDIRAIEVSGAHVSLRDPLKFGAANVPTEFDSLKVSMSFSSSPERWTAAFDDASWVGRAPDLTVTRLAGVMGRSRDGWFFEDLAVETPRSAFTVDGQVFIGDRPTVLDLDVRADRFAFQEWSGMVGGLRNIAVEASFETELDGPLTELVTGLALSGTGGSVRGEVTLNTRVPGWHGTGSIDVSDIDLSRWLNRTDRPSDVTGRLVFDLDLDFGGKFPRGTYRFEGPHAMYLGYAADDLRAEGRLVVGEALIDRLTALAYNARISSTSGSIGLDRPYPYSFTGSMSDLDLRRIPEEIPVPHVESDLAFDYTVIGRFSQPFITGSARFRDSEFLGAAVGAGTEGTIDTAAAPTTYSGDVAIRDVDLHRFAEGLAVEWLQDPRYAGTMSGRFRVQGAGGDSETMSLTASGRIERADLFHGAVTDADVSLEIERGTLASSFDGQIAGIDPAVAFASPQLGATLNGSADVRTVVRDLLVRSPALDDYEISGRLELDRSTLRGVEVVDTIVDATLASQRLTVRRLIVGGPTLEGSASGLLAFDDEGRSDFQYEVKRADLEGLQAITPGSAEGLVVTTGRLTGPAAAPHLVGTGSISSLDAFGVRALSVAGEYDITVPADAELDGASLGGTVTGRASFPELLGLRLQEISGDVTLVGHRAEFDLILTQAPGRTGQVAGAVRLHPNRQGIDLLSLQVAVGELPWQLSEPEVAEVRWSESGVTVTPMVFTAGIEEDQRISIGGTWRGDGTGALRVTATHVFLETLQDTSGGPPRFGGVLDLDALVYGTRAAPVVTGTIAVSNGRVERVTYERLAGRLEYRRGAFDVDVRLDQAPGIWLTAEGTLPRAVFDRSLPDGPIELVVRSGPIDLGLLSGLTTVVAGSSGLLRLDVQVTGTTGDPQFQGTVDVASAGFVVASTGVRYQNGRAAFRLSPDLITVESFHLEDEAGQILELRGSLATRELRVGEVAVDVTTNRFAVLRNEFGELDIDAALAIRGRFDSPRLAGSITISSAQLRVDRILERALFRPYATEAASIAAIDAVAALNPWDRLGLDVFLQVPRTLRLTGTDVQVSPGTPIGLGDINLRVGGELYLYKDPGQPLYPTGSLHQMSGTYVFQGRRFEIDDVASSIDFVNDLNPQLWIEVTREISGVQTRVTLTGSLGQPALRLASTPPLEESDILSLIVFNTTPDALTATQQEELAVRAATLAAGFLARPLVEAVQTELGLEVFEIEPGADPGAGPTVTIGEELAPGLVARFSRQFGQDPWNQASIEYYLSQLFRIRATFSDAQSLTARAAFRRVERAGIDLLVFFSF